MNMIEEEGIVIELNGEYAEVEAWQKSACGHCSARKGCGTSLLASLLGRRPRRFPAINRAGARPGDRVIVGVDAGALQAASFLMYLVPLLGLIGGALAGTWLSRLLVTADGELLSILLGVAGMALALLLVRRRFGRAGNRRFQAVVLRVLPETRMVAPLRVSA